jgi:hypothetical protein
MSPRIVVLEKLCVWWITSVGLENTLSSELLEPVLTNLTRFEEELIRPRFLRRTTAVAPMLYRIDPTKTMPRALLTHAHSGSACGISGVA